MVEIIKRRGPFYVSYFNDENEPGRSTDASIGIQLFRSWCVEVSVGRDSCCHTTLRCEIAPWPWVALTVFHWNLFLGGTRNYSMADDE